MKTINERAKLFLDALRLYNPELKYGNDAINKNAIIKLLKDQDKITRHACAENIIKLDDILGLDGTGGLIDSDSAYSTIINTKAI